MENFVFESRDAEARLKLVDFGFSRSFSTIPRMKTLVGTFYTMAPEVLDTSVAYSPSCDVWGLGVIAHILLSGQAPFEVTPLMGRKEIASALRKLKRGVKMKGPLWAGVSSNAKSFVSQALTYSAHERISSEDALHHPWIASLSAPSHHSVTADVPFATHREDMASRIDTLESLLRFRSYPSIKRHALCIIGYYFDSSKLKHLETLFLEM